MGHLSVTSSAQLLLVCLWMVLKCSSGTIHVYHRLAGGISTNLIYTIDNNYRSFLRPYFRDSDRVYLITADPSDTCLVKIRSKPEHYEDLLPSKFVLLVDDERCDAGFHVKILNAQKNGYDGVIVHPAWINKERTRPFPVKIPDRVAERIKINLDFIGYDHGVELRRFAFDRSSGTRFLLKFPGPAKTNDPEQWSTTKAFAIAMIALIASLFLLRWVFVPKRLPDPATITLTPRAAPPTLPVAVGARSTAAFQEEVVVNRGTFLRQPDWWNIPSRSQYAPITLTPRAAPPTLPVDVGAGFEAAFREEVVDNRGTFHRQPDSWNIPSRSPYAPVTLTPRGTPPTLPFAVSARLEAAFREEAVARFIDQLILQAQSQQEDELLRVSGQPLTADELDQLTTVPVTKVTEDICPMCQENLILGEIVIIPNCNHGGHKTCLATWLTTCSRRCPVCRQTIEPT